MAENDSQMDMLNSINDGFDIHTQEVLLAASNHDIRTLRDLLRNTLATVQDPETGCAPLHAAIAACEPDEAQVNGNHIEANGGDEERARTLEAAAETVRFLIRNGAVWDEIDSAGETPGCIARRLGLEEIYQIIVDAGVRAELLLNRLGEYERLDDNEEDDSTAQDQEVNGEPARVEDVSANPVDDILSTILQLSQDGVPMAWQKPIMEAHAAKLLPVEGLRILNIGHSSGLVDSLFQAKKPATHYIIEAHPQVLDTMREQGWMVKPRLLVHDGHWRDVLPKLMSGSEEVIFDAIFFNTVGEDYKALKEFFSEWVVQLLDPEGRFGFFNAMGADKQVRYDVYQKVVEMDLFEAGFDIDWEDIRVPHPGQTGETDGIQPPNWGLETYRLPTCKSHR